MSARAAAFARRTPARVPQAGRLLVGVLIACVFGGVVACTNGGHGGPAPSGQIFVTLSSTPTAAPTTARPSSVGSVAPHPSLAPSTSASPLLPAGCSQLLPLGTLDHILGMGLLGQVTYLRAAAVPQSGRTGRVTCGYGTPTVVPSGVVGVPGAGSATPSGSAAAPLVDVSYITYVNAATAAARVQTTVDADGASAVVTDVTVSGKPAEVLLGADTTELVMSDGARTVVVVLAPTVVDAAKAPGELEAIAATMLQFGQQAVSVGVSASQVASGSAR